MPPILPPSPGMFFFFCCLFCSAICLDLMEKAEVLEYYEDASVRTVQLE